MSELRRELQGARERLRRETYPGDLAADVLRRVSGPRRRLAYWIGGAVASAVAAGVAIMLLVHPHGTTAPPSGPTGVWPGTLARITPPGPPEMPSGIPLTPSYQSVSNIPAKPSFPSIFSPPAKEEAL
jgi:hypothetical protein